ncbi:hypothetical protein MRX96_042739 [Rhipicephalus microplus]
MEEAETFVRRVATAALFDQRCSVAGVPFRLGRHRKQEDLLDAPEEQKYQEPNYEWCSGYVHQSLVPVSGSKLQRVNEVPNHEKPHFRRRDRVGPTEAGEFPAGLPQKKHAGRISPRAALNLAEKPSVADVRP